MPTRPRERERPAAGRAGLEDLILRAAEAEFAERGFEGATTAAIAARAGIPKANLHYYVPTKEALYRRVLDGVAGAWLEAAGDFERGQPAETALRRYIGAKMDLARERPEGSRIFAREVMGGAAMLGDFLDATLGPWVAARSAAIRDWIADGQLREIEPRTLLYLIWAATQHYADFAAQIAALNGGAPLDDAAFARAKAEVAEVLVRGVLAPRAGTGAPPRA